MCIYRRKDKGPINFQAMVPQSVLNHALVLSICKEYRIMSADIFCRCDATVDQLIDVIEVSAFDVLLLKCTYIPSRYYYYCYYHLCNFNYY